MSINLKYRDELPANISKTYLEYSDEQNTIRKMGLLFDIFSQTLRFFGCIFLSEYLWSEDNDQKINEHIRKLSRPSLGVWKAFVFAYFNAKEENTFLDQLGYDCFWDAQDDLDNVYKGRFRNEKDQSKNAFDHIIAVRNQIAHGAMYPTEKDAQEILDVYSVFVRHILDSFLPVLQRFKVAKCNGTSKDKATKSLTAYFNLINYEKVSDENFPIVYERCKTEEGYDAGEFFRKDSFYLIDLEKPTRAFRFPELLNDFMDICDPGERDAHEIYYLYDGYGNTKVTYIGVREKRMIEQYISEIRSKFTERGSKMHWEHHDFTMEGFRVYINELTSVTIEMHERSGKYDPARYISRACDEEIKSFINSDKTTLIVSAEAGAGKTNLLCHFSSELMNDRERYAVFFYNGSGLTVTDAKEHAYNSLFAKLEAECLENGDFLNVSDFLNFVNQQNKENIRLVLVVDAVNEAYDVTSVLREVEEITSLGANYPWLKIILSIRDAGYQMLQNKIINGMGRDLPILRPENLDRYYTVSGEDDSEKPRYELEIKRWNILQVMNAYDNYRDSYGVDESDIPAYSELERDIQAALTNPLNMKLYFDAVKDDKMAVHTEMDLFRALYLKYVSEPVEAASGNKVTECTARLQDLIVEEMIRNRENTINSDTCDEYDDQVRKEFKIEDSILVLKPIERLIDRGIVYEQGTGEKDDLLRFSFVYQKYLEYLLYLNRIRDEQEGLKDTVSLFMDSMTWEKLPEMHEACKLSFNRYDDQSSVINEIFDQAAERGISLETFKTTIRDMICQEYLDHDPEDTDMINGYLQILADHGVIDWAMEIVNDLRHQAFSDHAEKLSDMMLARTDISDSTRYQLMFHKAMVCQNESRFKDTLELLDQCLEDGGDCISKNLVLVQKAKTIRKMGNIDESRQFLQDHFGDADEDTPYYAYALIQRGLCSVAVNNDDEALADYNAALEISRHQNDHHTEYYNLLGIGNIYKRKGDFDRANEVAMTIYDGTSKYGYLDLLSDSLHGLAHNAILEEKYDAAQKYAEQAIIIWERNKHFEGLPIMYVILAITAKKNGDLSKASAMIEKKEMYMGFVSDKAVIDEIEGLMELYER